MKKTPSFLVAAVAALIVAASGLATAAEDRHEAQHGGIFTAGKEADYELVVKPTVIQLYVTDHGKPRDVSKASAKLTLLAGSEKQEVDLKPAGGKLEATGSFRVAPGTKAIAVVQDGGKTLGTARFVFK